MVSTYATRGGQRLVKNSAEAMAFFKAANFLDCRISAYPKYTDYYINRTGIAPTVLLVDIDREHFTSEEFELITTKTYTNFEKILGSKPMQLWTGGGRHFLTSQSVPVLEKIEDFKEFDQPSRGFLQFEERLLSDNKADQSHWKTVSFNNCMLRVPGSLNSSCIKFDDRGRIIDIPYDARVRIEKHCDGNIPVVEKAMLVRYLKHLQFSAIVDIRKQKVREIKYRRYHRSQKPINNYGYDYIEKLFNKPLDDFRKYCIWKIFVPYFINVKKLSRLEAFDRIKSWLDKCNSINRLDFNPKQKIDYELVHVGGYWPPGLDKLKDIAARVQQLA